MNKKILIGAVAILVVAAAAGGWFFMKPKPAPVAQQVPQRDILIGFSMGTLQEERWQRDRDEFLKKADELGVVVDLQAANNNVETQISQIEGMIFKGVDVLVIAPHDADKLTAVIDKAHQAGIKVMSYDRLITKADIDLYLSFDNVKVGEYQATYILQAVAAKIAAGQKVKIAYIGGAKTDNNAFLFKKGAFNILQPAIDKGQVEIVVDKFSDNWDPQNAYKNLKAYLDKNDGLIDAVVAANDGTAFGSISALKEYGLDGKVPVSGQDAELSAIKRIIAGTQSMTVYKPISKLAAAGVELAIKLAEGAPINSVSTVNNVKMDVPSILLESIAVTKDNIDQTVMTDGYYSSKDIY